MLTSSEKQKGEMMETIYLDMNYRICLGEPQLRIVITNPQALKSVSANSLESRLQGLGKLELEGWLADTILADSMAAIVNHEKVADLTHISGLIAETDINYPDKPESWKIAIRNNVFIKILKKLKIFKIIKDTTEEIQLEYVD